MRIVCETCQAKYSISDDKVAGKVFKIRCKKCSAVIVVRSGAVDAPLPPPPSEDAIWHLVIAQDQVGPFTAAEVERKLAGGEADADTYGWREGQDDWLPLRQIDAFAAVAAPAPAAPEPARPDVFAARQRDDSGGARDRGDSGGARDRGDSGELFASVAPGPAAPRLHGERNESSVLFSLGNLQQLAHDPPRAAAATPASGTEGSGLIDIRSMASAYLGTPAAKPTSAGIGSIDDLPVFGGGGFSEPAVIVPAAAPRANHKLMYAMIGAMAALAIAATIMLVMLMKGDNKPTQVATATPPAPPAETPPPTRPAQPPAPPVAATPEPAAAPVAAPPAPPPSPAPHAQPAHRDPAPKAAAAKKVEPAAAPPPPKEEAGDCSDVSCMVSDYAGACCAKYRPHAAAAPAPHVASDLPEGLDKAMITAGLEKIRARAMACGNSSPAKGKVHLHIKVGGDGRVASASYDESPDPKLGACVVSAVQGATFAKTQNGRSFAYPFVF